MRLYVVGAYSTKPTKMKVNQPRKIRYLNETPESRRRKLKNRIKYKAKKAVIKKQNKLYRQRNQHKIKMRQNWLKRAHRKPPKFRTRGQSFVVTCGVTVSMPQHEKMKKVFDALIYVVRDAQLKAKDAPKYDLCKLTLPDGNPFADDSMGVSRSDMPQLKGKTVPGSWAAQHGEYYNAEPLFRKFLQDQGVRLTAGKLNASRLRPMQGEILGNKVADMVATLRKDPKDPSITAQLYVAKDGRILDGHHRWAALVGREVESKTPVLVNVIRVGVNGPELLSLARRFAKQVGIKQESLT